MHEAIRPKLAEQWKAWAAKNYETLKEISAASASYAPAMAAADNEELADILGSEAWSWGLNKKHCWFAVIYEKAEENACHNSNIIQNKMTELEHNKSIM